MPKSPHNLTLDDEVFEMAERICEALHVASVTALIERLIVEEYEKRTGPIRIRTKGKKPSSNAASDAGGLARKAGDL